MKRLPAGLVFAALLPLACSRGRTTSAVTPTDVCPAVTPRAAKPVTITMWSSRPELVGVVNDFNAAQSAVRVVVDEGPVAPNSAPDVARNESRFFTAAEHHGRLPDLVTLSAWRERAATATGALVPAQDCITTHHTDLSGFVPATLATKNINGTQWGMPVAFRGRLLAYNAQAFTQAGLDPDRPPTDLLSLVVDARALQAHGISAPLAPPDMQIWLDASRVRYTDHDNGTTGAPTRTAFDNPTSRAVAGALFALTATSAVGPLPQSTDPGLDPGFSELGTGQTAMAVIDTASLKAYAVAIAAGQAPRLTARFGPIPTADGHGAVVDGSDAFFLTASATPARRAAAWDFISWFEQPVQQARLAQTTSFLPDQKASPSDPDLAPDWKQYPTLRDAWDVLTTSPSVQVSPAPPLGAIEHQAANALQHDIADTGMIVDAAIADADRSITATIADYRADPAAWARCFAEPGGQCG